MKKKGNKKMPTPRRKLIHNPIPTSLFLSSPQCISYSQFNVKMFFLCLMHSQQTNKIQNRDVGMGLEFVSWCRHLLVSFLFHALTSLHPPSFHRNDFSTCTYTITSVPGTKTSVPINIGTMTSIPREFGTMTSVPRKFGTMTGVPQGIGTMTSVHEKNWYNHHCTWYKN